ncbi:MAG: cobaltochelatase subunit CobN, partial [Caldilineaceae bacterium]|nr:cobaltochelatase subunit CobN [Caldilineaceae bacterium]
MALESASGSMQRRDRNYVVRPDGKPINVPRQRGQLFVCENGCCCGHTDRGFAPVPHDLYYEEWMRRKLRNRVHLNHAGCLGPCALANVVLLIFDGHPIWFHSVNNERLILAIFNYIDAMLEADRLLPPPPALVTHVFNGFAWAGKEAAATVEFSAETPPDQLAGPLLRSRIVFLSHADTDLLVLDRAAARLPEEFPPVTGINLRSLPTAAHVEEFMRTELQDVQVIVLRTYGGRQGFLHGFDRFVDGVRRRNIDLICVPGTEGFDPELTAHSSASVPIIHDVYRYLHFGGEENLEQMLRFLADHLLAGGWGYELPQEVARHGLYQVAGLAQAASEGNSRQPIIGILFYRSHWLSGNTQFVDALARAIEEAGGQALPIFTTSLKELSSQPDESSAARPAAFDFLYDEHGNCLVDILISTISFAMGGVNTGGVTQSGWNVRALEALDVPIIQAITSGMEEPEWRVSTRGLGPLDVAMNVALPEFDGRIISVPLSFKESARECCAHGQCGAAEASRYLALPDRARTIARLALRFAALRRKPNHEKRIAFVLTNSSSKADRIGNAVGLDAPASLLRVFARLREAGYAIDNVPESSDALLHTLIGRCAYDENLLTEAQLAQAPGQVPATVYGRWFERLTEGQQDKIQQRWGDPPGEVFVHSDEQGRPRHIAVAGLELGNVFVAIQPPRGYGMDPDAIYHTPDLPPTHHYHAFYRWLCTPQQNGGWGADAIVHMGKHGTLEWLPGKGIGLSQECFPDAFLAELPFFYPFIINNPGEGAQAKRRTHAVIVDHMIPPMTSADVYGELALLTQLVDEYYQVEQMDPSKLPLIQQQIWELMEAANLTQDLTEMLRKVDHGDHSHEWDGSYTDDGTPLTLAEMKGTDFQHLLEDIDGYLCELGSLQIRDGLHVLGHVPEGDQLCALLRALTRIPNNDVPSLRAGVAAALGWDLNELLEQRGSRLATGAWRLLVRGEERQCMTCADVIDVVDMLCLQLLQDLNAANFEPSEIEPVIDQAFSAVHVLAALHSTRTRQPDASLFRPIVLTLTFVCGELVPLIRQNDAEIENLLHALNGGYVPAGPAGAPTRGMAHILPTGRNFYAVDPRAIPSQAAWRVGQQLASAVIERYQQEEGAFPESVGLSIWGTSAMRTHGDDIAQCLALLGVRPIWQAESRRVTDFAVVPLAELGRPRVDVLMRISGFFRDAFPHLIDLLDQAVRTVAHLDEPVEQNFVRKHYLQALGEQIAAGRTDAEADRRAAYRIFGSMPGSYGAGILPLIHAQN